MTHEERKRLITKYVPDLIQKSMNYLELLNDDILNLIKNDFDDIDSKNLKEMNLSFCTTVLSTMICEFLASCDGYDKPEIFNKIMEQIRITFLERLSVKKNLKNKGIKNDS